MCFGCGGRNPRRLKLELHPMCASQMKGRETEAKFLVESLALLRKIGSLDCLGPFRLIHRQSERQENTYWDTEDLRLRRGRAALKMRRVGSRAEVTFKREIAYRNGVSDRIEVTVPYRPIDSTRLIEPIRLARKITGSRPLKEVLTLRTFRRKLLFGCSRQRIELDLDRVVVQRAGKPVATHREVELENLSASEVLFREALRAFKGRFGRALRFSRVSKYEMGLRLLKSRCRVQVGL